MHILLLGILIGGVIGFLLGILVSRRQPSRRSEATPLLDSILDRQGGGLPASSSADSTLESLRQNLRLKCMYDEVKIDRLIETERERSPEGSLEELMRAAIYRWERENR